MPVGRSTAISAVRYLLKYLRAYPNKLRRRFRIMDERPNRVGETIDLPPPHTTAPSSVTVIVHVNVLSVNLRLQRQRR